MIQTSRRAPLFKNRLVKASLILPLILSLISCANAQTASPENPTATLEPISFSTLIPTATVNTPTSSPTPLPAATATETPVPTETPTLVVLSATPTPIPPTDTPAPTATPAPPTVTPLPTETPTPSFSFSVLELLPFSFTSDNPNFDVYVAVTDANNMPLPGYKLIGLHSSGLQLESAVSANAWTENSGAMHYKAGNIKYQALNSPGGVWVLQLVDANGQAVAPPQEFPFDVSNPSWYFILFRKVN